MNFDKLLREKGFENLAYSTNDNHEERYIKIAELLGYEDVKKLIPFKMETLKKAYKEDRHFNNLSMDKWDRVSGFFCPPGDCKFIGGGIVPLYNKIGVNEFSNCDGVCILKAVARSEVLKATERGEEDVKGS